MYHTISNTEITVYIMMSEIYISRRWAKLPLAENIRDIGTSVNTVASLLIEFKKYI